LNADSAGVWVGFVLTLMIFSYLLGDNVLYRIAVYAFAGLTAGFVTMVAVESVIMPWIRATLLAADAPLTTLIVGALPFGIGVLLLARTSRRFGRIGALGLAFVIGIGTAVALVGAVSGTLIPLTTRTVEDVRLAAPAADGTNDSMLDAFIAAVGVVCTLIYFQYSARRVPGASGQTRRGLLVRAMGAVGQGFLVVTLASLYAGAMLTGLTMLSDRLVVVFTQLLGG